MESLHASLLALQELDEEIARIEKRLKEFDPRLAELDSPIDAYSRDVDATRTRVGDMRQDLTRLERSAEQKRQRLQVYEERMMKVRNAREEAAARTEMDLVKSALDADVQELGDLREQLTRTDLKLDDMDEHLAKLQAEAAPRRDELLAGRAEIESELAVLRDKRENQATRLDPASRRLYDRVRSGRARRVLAPLTDEGACGACFNVLPLQEQADVRRGQSLRRCEACGVILYIE